jgi:cobalt-zinc-cadmium efflux system outer membrane protein
VTVGWLPLLVVVLGLVASVGSSRAQTPAVTPVPLTLERVVEQFLQRNLAVEAGRFRVDVARAEQIAARLRPNPTLTLAAENLKVAGPTAAGDLYELSATYSQPLEWSNVRRLRAEVGDLNVTGAEAQLADVLRQRLAEVKRVFLEGVLARHALRNAEENYRGFEELLRFNQVRFREGAIAEGELLKTRVERVKFDATIAQARLAVRQATVRLLGLLGESDFAEVPIAGDFTFQAGSIDVSALREVTLRAAPSIKVAEAVVQLAVRRVALEEARGAPLVSPFAGFKRAGPDSTVLLGVAIPLPLFDRNQAGVARARAEADLARTELARARTRVLAEVELAYAAWQSAQQRVLAFQRELLPQAEEVRMIAEAAYKEGAIDLLALLDAERTRADVRQQYAQALFDHQVSLVLLEAASGADHKP